MTSLSLGDITTVEQADELLDRLAELDWDDDDYGRVMEKRDQLAARETQAKKPAPPKKKTPSDHLTQLKRQIVGIDKTYPTLTEEARKEALVTKRVAEVKAANLEGAVQFGHLDDAALDRAIRDARIEREEADEARKRYPKGSARQERAEEQFRSTCA